jgi:hypothetical protein
LNGRSFEECACYSSPNAPRAAGNFSSQKRKTKAQAHLLHEKVVAGKAGGSFESAWRLYHDTFANNQQQVLDGIYDAFMRNFQYITPTNLAGTVGLFKDLGREDQARKMIRHYVENRNEDRELFDLDANPFGGDIRDPDIRAAFAEKCAQLEPGRDVGTILRTLKEGWNDDDIMGCRQRQLRNTAPRLRLRKGMNSERCFRECFNLIELQMHRTR